MMTKYKTEYRINKKGCECFRTNNREAAFAKLADLRQKHDYYTMQIRTCKMDRFGMLLRDCSGKVLWSSWN